MLRVVPIAVVNGVFIYLGAPMAHSSRPTAPGVYLGVSRAGKKVMCGNQFLQRLRALAVPLPTKLRTDEPSERAILVLGRGETLRDAPPRCAAEMRRRTSRADASGVAARFTGLQLACLSTLWALKLTPGLGMVFPAAIGVLMFIRAQLLPRLFTRRQLSQVDTPVWSIRVAGAPARQCTSQV